MKQILLMISLLGIASCAHQDQPSTAMNVATGFVAHQLCGAAFISGIDPDHYAEDLIEPVLAPAGFFFSYKTNMNQGEAVANLGALNTSRAIYTKEFGCTRSISIQETLPQKTKQLPPPPVKAINQQVDFAIDKAFIENSPEAKRHTSAIVVLHKGKIIGERYATGYSAATPIQGWLASTSMIAALIGVLTQKKMLAVTDSLSIPAWSQPGDLRQKITIEHLMRMTSGLELGNSQTSGFMSLFDFSAQMLFTKTDMARYAEETELKKQPGEWWNYSFASYILLSRLVRQKIGSAKEFKAFTQKELFTPAGMLHVAMDFDKAETPIGSSHFYATARDWAKLGDLFLNDGVVKGKRIFPVGWADFCAKMTPGSEDTGYGAGFWTNRGDSHGARYRTEHGMPADAYMARGNFGQYVIIVPSKQLVIARFGNSFTKWDDIDAVAALTKALVTAI